MSLSTHILDVARGVPAAGVAVVLERMDGGKWAVIAQDVTSADGRVAALLPVGAALTPGDYRLRFATGDYFQMLGLPAFYPEVTVHVRIDAGSVRYHLPLLLSPYGYSTYKGS
jgi:5-hydroxyisourate hydrolase